jgi:acetylornithine deacetylase/succinyl-diaminopimelate desuccinylase-like protein
MLQDGLYMDALQRAHEAAWGVPAVVERTGGSVPIIGMFAQHLGAPITNVMLGRGGAFHAPNEYLEQDSVDRSIALAIHMLYALGEAV